jgi:hypothetical protein
MINWRDEKSANVESFKSTSQLFMKAKLNFIL